MKYFGKKIAAMGAAVMMAVSMMSVNVGAKEVYSKYGSWKLFCAPDSNNNNKYQCTVKLQHKYDTNYVVESCEKYSTSMSNAYATVTPKITDQNGNEIDYCFANEKTHSKYEYSSSDRIASTYNGRIRRFVQEKHKTNYVTIKGKYIVRLKYSLQNYGTYCSINGTAFLN